MHERGTNKFSIPRKDIFTLIFGAGTTKNKGLCPLNY
jgi:hypothetical protein